MLNNWLLAVRLFVAFRLTKARFVLPSYGQLKSTWVGQKLSVIKDAICFVSKFYLLVIQSGFLDPRGRRSHEYGNS